MLSQACLMHLPIPTVPHPRADPRELGFFESKLANAPLPGQKSCSHAPGLGPKNVLFSSFLDLLSIKSKLIQAKFSPSWALYCKNRPFCSSSVLFMSYLDTFKKKLTVFADKLVVKRSDKCCKVKEVRWSNAPG